MRKLADLAEKRDPETCEHLLRIQKYCHFIAEILSVQEKYRGLINDKFIEDIYYSSALHDIGKVGIEDRILLKPGKLTSDEWAVMKTHALLGAEILKGERIPLSARIMALADVYDALTSKRIYKEAFTQEVAESTIKKEIGSHYDPDVGIVFMEHSKKFIEIRDRFHDEVVSQCLI